MFKKVYFFLSTIITMVKTGMAIAPVELRLLPEHWLERFKRWAKKKYRRRARRVKLFLNTNLYTRPKRLFKIIFSIFFLLLIEATPSNLFLYWCRFVMEMGMVSRGFFWMAVNQYWSHPKFYWYTKITATTVFILKFYQELKYNFKCPVATLIYGVIVSPEEEERLKKERLERIEKMKKKKLHKFVADPFLAKQEKRKELAAKRVIFEARAEKEIRLLNKVKKSWKDHKVDFSDDRVFFRERWQYKHRKDYRTYRRVIKPLKRIKQK